jgi:phenylalanyl-tRNA synthetase beta chain
MEIDCGAKVSSQITDEYVNKYDEISLSFTKAYVDRYTGIDIPDEQILSTLNLLGFNAKLSGEEFSVTVPSWRATKDVTIKADVIEEITRIYGYDNFEITTTKSALTPVRESVLHRDSEWIKDILVQRYMMNEVHSYIWCDGNKYKKLGIDVEENVTILNIATPENGTIRNSMLPTLLTFAYENKQYAPSYSLFEIGRVVDGVTAENTCNERSRLGITLFDKTCSEKELYFRAVEIVRYIGEQLRHSDVEFTRIAPAHNWQHPKNTSEISLGGQKIGVLCTLHPSNLKKLDKNAAVVCIEIDMEDFEKTALLPLKFNEPSKFPGLDYDLSLVTNGRKYSEISPAWERETISELDGVSLVDTYELDGEMSITLRFSFSSNERTLSMDEIQQHIDKIISNLTAIGVTMRV